MKWFRVEVSDREGQVVAIESEMLAGRDIGDSERETIECAIENLMGFVGVKYRGECICPTCGLRHGGSNVDGGF